MVTQAPYSIFIFLVSILVGTLPVAASNNGGGYSTGIAIAVGTAIVILSVYLLAAPAVSQSARYDPLTELYLLVRSKLFKSNDEELEKLRMDTKSYYFLEQMPAEPGVQQEQTQLA